MKKFLKIGTRITITFTSLFVVLVLAGGFFLQREGAKRSVQAAEESMRSINLTVAENIASFFKVEKEMANVLAVSPAIYDFLKAIPETETYQNERQKVTEKLNLSLEQSAMIHRLILLDKNGKVLVLSNTDEKNTGSSGDTFFDAEKAIASKDFSFSNKTEQILYSLSSSVKDPDTKKILGTIIVEMHPGDLYNLLHSNTTKKTEESFLINKEGYFVSKTHLLTDSDILKKKYETQDIKDCLASKTNSNEENSILWNAGIKSSVNYRGIPVIGVYSYLPDADMCVVTETETSEIIASSSQMTDIFLLAGLFSSLFFIFVGYLLSRRISKPLEVLREGVEVIEKGNLDFKVGTNSEDEIGALSRAFDKMTSSLKKTKEEIDKKVKEQTYEITRKAEQLETQQKATLNILSDIEREKEKAEIFAKDLEKFKLAVDGASDGVVITDVEGIILSVNQGAEKITGFPKEEIVGQKAGCKKNWGGLQDVPFYENLWSIIKTQKKVYIGGMENRRKNGEKYEAILHISPILDKDKEVKFFVGIERDISKEKMIDRSKTEFVSLASHQLRTPLSFVNWYSEMLLGGEVGPLNEKQKKYLGEIYAGNQRMIDLVNSLLNVSRLDLGTFIIEPIQINIQEMTKSLLKELRPQSEKKHIVIQEDYDSIPPTFLADPKLLRMVFQNLLTNAIKYNQDSGTVMLNVQKVDKKIIFAGQEMKEENLVISVSDRGIGIPDEQKDKIFTKLFRTDNAKVSESEGNGLGLYIIKSIIDQSGGQIWFDSKENQGSTFYVSFPLSGMKKKEGTKKLD